MIKHLFHLLLLMLLAACKNAPNKLPSPQAAVLSAAATESPVAPAAAVIYRSLDHGQTWEPYANGIPEDATVNDFVSNGRNLFAATESHGVFMETGGNNWLSISHLLPKGIDLNAIELFGESGIVVGSSRHGIFVSHDTGKTWKQDPGAIHNIQIRCLLVYKNQWLAGTDNGIYRSLDQGKNWTHLYGTLQVNGFAQTNGKIYAAVVDGAILSTDEGNSWSYIYQPFALHDITSDEQQVYAMTMGEGLLQSANDGQTWENINAGLDSRDRYTFEVQNIGNELFAGQWEGVFHRQLAGGPWIKVAGGWPESTAFTTLSVVKEVIWAGTGLKR